MYIKIFMKTTFILSQGLFSRLTFNQPLYIGGAGKMKNVDQFVGKTGGLTGCVRHLEINNKAHLNNSLMFFSVKFRCSISSP